MQGIPEFSPAGGDGRLCYALAIVNGVLLVIGDALGRFTRAPALVPPSWQ